jgi:hypothetical protein
MTAPNLNMIFADYGVPYSGRCRKATELHCTNTIIHFYYSNRDSLSLCDIPSFIFL